MGRAIFNWVLRIILVLAVLLAGMIIWQWDNFQRLFLGGVKVFETTAPPMPADFKRPSILVFSKTNGFRHAETITAANALLASQAAKNGWGIFQTENGAVFNPQSLAKFDAVVFNNVSGDVFTPEQKTAFQTYLNNGGGFVGIHAVGGDFSYNWEWHPKDLIGAQFIGHTMSPQFQRATVRFENSAHPVAKGLPLSLSRKEEWYSFDASPRTKGYTIHATVDESSYNPGTIFGTDLRMGKDHPIAWSHCIGKGRVFYSAMGHLPEAYGEPTHQKLIENAIGWSMRLRGEECGGKALQGAK
jgi:uncharacterized protein